MSRFTEEDWESIYERFPRKTGKIEVESSLFDTALRLANDSPPDVRFVPDGYVEMLEAAYRALLDRQEAIAHYLKRAKGER